MREENLNHIMIVEDSDDDYEATERALRKDGRLRNPLIRFECAEQAIKYLEREGEYAAAPRPSIVLLDLNMPGVGGHAVLRRIKLDEALKFIPVIVLTTSDDRRDIDDCYREGANSYITKPVTLDGYLKAVRDLRDYWIHLSLLPGERR